MINNLYVDVPHRGIKISKINNEVFKVVVTNDGGKMEVKSEDATIELKKATRKAYKWLFKQADSYLQDAYKKISNLTYDYDSADFIEANEVIMHNFNDTRTEILRILQKVKDESDKFYHDKVGYDVFIEVQKAKTTDPKEILVIACFEIDLEIFEALEAFGLANADHTGNNVENVFYFIYFVHAKDIAKIPFTGEAKSFIDGLKEDLLGIEIRIPQKRIVKLREEQKLKEKELQKPKLS